MPRRTGPSHPKWKGGRGRTTKPCHRCKTEKPVSEFWRDRHSHDGYISACKPCSYSQHKEFLARNPNYAAEKMHAQALARIGSSLHEYAVMFAKQDGLCLICGEQETGNKNKKLSMDHDHRSGKVRGLLCNRCNRGLGLFRDNPSVLRKAAEYLEESCPRIWLAL